MAVVTYAERLQGADPQGWLPADCDVVDEDGGVYLVTCAWEHRRAVDAARPSSAQGGPVTLYRGPLGSLPVETVEVPRSLVEQLVAETGGSVTHTARDETVAAIAAVVGVEAPAKARGVR